MSPLEHPYTVLSVAVLVVLPNCTGCKKDHEGLVRGQCGLESQWVECFTFEDCDGKTCRLGRCNWCTSTGNCVRVESDDCDWILGGCGPNAVCDSDYCYPACTAHRDCEPEAECNCFMREDFVPSTVSAGFCDYPRCNLDGVCPDGTEIIRGSYACFPTFSQGDCLKPSNRLDCPPGYEPQGETVCWMVEPYAWRNRDAGTGDAGPLDGGSPDGTATDGGVPEAGAPDGSAPDAGQPDGG